MTSRVAALAMERSRSRPSVTALTTAASRYQVLLFRVVSTMGAHRAFQVCGDQADRDQCRDRSHADAGLGQQVGERDDEIAVGGAERGAEQQEDDGVGRRRLWCRSTARSVPVTIDLSGPVGAGATAAVTQTSGFSVALGRKNPLTMRPAPDRGAFGERHDGRQVAGRAGPYPAASDRDLFRRRHAGRRAGHDAGRLSHQLLCRACRHPARRRRSLLHGRAAARHPLRSGARHRDGSHAHALRKVPALAGGGGADPDRRLDRDLLSAGRRRQPLSDRLAARPLCRLFDADPVAGGMGRGAGRRISSAQPRLWLDPGGRGRRRARRAAGAAAAAAGLARGAVQGRAADGLLRSLRRSSLGASHHGFLRARAATTRAQGPNASA